MAGFAHTQLLEGEVLMIGPVTFSSSTSVSFGAGAAQAQAGRRNERTIGITNRRVIVEQGGQPGQSEVLDNAEVRRVYLRREPAGCKLEKVEAAGGRSVKLDLGGLNLVQEARLFELFPNAEIGEQKGLFGGFSMVTPRPIPAPPARPAPRAQAARPVPAAAPAVPQAAAAGYAQTHIDDADIRTLDDLRRCYPLPDGYEYAQTPEGAFVVKRLSDEAQFRFLVEEGMLGFDVPVQDPKRKKVTVEVIKRN